MNVRDATPDDEPWLLEALEEVGQHDPGFRYYHYVVVTSDDGERVGLGRLAARDNETAELNHVVGFGERATVARAQAARALVKRALEEGYETVAVAADTTRPFDAVGFRESTVDTLDASDTDTAMRWIPPSEREDSDDEASTGQTAEKADDDASQANAGDDSPDSGTPLSEEAERAEPDRGGSHKYDPSASSPATGAQQDSSGEQSPPQSGDDSTAAAARRQGINPDAVNTKYDTDSEERSRTSKYDTESENPSAAEKADADSDDEETETKYDTESEKQSKNTKYDV
jgi:hypothetical protein